MAAATAPATVDAKAGYSGASWAARWSFASVMTTVDELAGAKAAQLGLWMAAYSGFGSAAKSDAARAGA